MVFLKFRVSQISETLFLIYWIIQALFPRQFGYHVHNKTSIISEFKQDSELA